MPTVLESLNHGLHNALEHDKNVIVIGEDILDPYGGAFKVTRGLSTRFPGRVLTTPISEAGMVGLAGGMALRGLRPVVEIMFGDFITLTADQLINHISKYRHMYNQQVRVPLVIRTPMGGRRGYGPTHSQTLEKLFLGVPGLSVFAINAYDNPGLLLEETILTTEDPVLFIENKNLYPQTIQDTHTLVEFSCDIHSSPLTHTFSLKGAPPPVLTIASYGYMAELTRQAALKLAYEHEVFVEQVIYTQIAPFDLQALFPSLLRSRRLLTVEEGTYTLGWGAEILARAAQTFGSSLNRSARIAADELPIPASGELEKQVLPQMNDIIRAALALVE